MTKYKADEAATFEQDVARVLDNVQNMLIEKNRLYGNSALEPSRIFSRSSSIEQLKVRIDDKLTRMRNMQPDETEDVEMDLLGYLVLLQVARTRLQMRLFPGAEPVPPGMRQPVLAKEGFLSPRERAHSSPRSCQDPGAAPRIPFPPPERQW